MPYTKTEVKSVLQRKFNFVEVEGKSHERYSFFSTKGRKIATIGFSRGIRRNESIHPSILDRMAKEVRAQTLSFFKGMIDCPISKTEYLKKLREQGFDV